MDTAAATSRPCCTICLEHVRHPRAKFVLPCTHCFHRRCLVALILHTPTTLVCPLCRDDMTDAVIDAVFAAHMLSQ